MAAMDMEDISGEGTPLTESAADHVIQITNEEMMALSAHNDMAFSALEKQFDVKIVCRGNEIRIIGKAENARDSSRVVDTWLAATRQPGESGKIPKQQIHYAINAVKTNAEQGLKKALGEYVPLPYKGRRVAAMTLGQKRYLDAIRENDVVFGIGPAGTGKTYLAMAMAVWSLTESRVARIILTRPVVEAGESLGFLPGDIAQKVDPYLRPLYDALFVMLGPERSNDLMESGIIEVAPLAYMRGRTLNNAFIVLDEAQNTTTEQMKMFLTRLGFDSKVVVTGDVTQIDLPRHRKSGLIQASNILRGIPQIGFVDLDESDVVRHSLVQEIIRAYDRHAASVETDKA